MNKLFDFLSARPIIRDLLLFCLIGGAAWALGYYQNSQALVNCQADRVELQKQHTADKAFQHSIFYGRQLAQKDSTIREKEKQLLALRFQARLDSAALLSLRESMAAINARYQSAR